MIAGDGGMLSRHRRQVRRCMGDGLHPRLLIHRNRDHVQGGYSRRSGLIVQRHFLVHQQDFPHLAFEGRIATLPVVSHLVRWQGLRRQNPMDGRLGGLGQRRMAGGPGLPAYVLGQGLSRPKLRGVAQSFGCEQATWTTQALASSVSFGGLPWGASWSPAVTPTLNTRLIHLATLLRVRWTACMIVAML